MQGAKWFAKRATKFNTAATLGLTLAGLLAHTDAAHAQMIETDFPSDIPGYGPNLSASVVNRILLQGEATGINAGGFVIRPQASESTGYKSEALGTPGSGSFYNNTQASLAAASDSTNGNFGASLSVSNQRYWKLPEANYTNWNAGLGGSINLGNDLATLSYAHSASNLGATDLGVIGVVTPVPYNVDDVRLSYDKDLARLSVTPSFEYQRYQFGQSTGRVTIRYNTLNHQIEAGGVTGRYEFSAGDGAVAIFKTSQAQFGSSPVSSYVDYNGVVGLDFRGPSIIQYRVLAGVESRRFPNGPSESVTAPTFELDGVWTPTELDTVTMTGYRELQNPTSPFAFNQIETIGKIELDHELRQNVFLRADGQYGLSQAQSHVAGLAGTQQTQFNVGFAAFWNINQNMRGNANYAYSSGMSRGGGVPADGIGFSNFSNQSITIGVSFFE